MRVTLQRGFAIITTLDPRRKRNFDVEMHQRPGANFCESQDYTYLDFVKSPNASIRKPAGRCNLHPVIWAIQCILFLGVCGNTVYICLKHVGGADGGWSTWTDWESCSVTCGTGLRRRIRSCSNPVPRAPGNHCDGDSTDFELCFNRTCAEDFIYVHPPKLLGVDGGWSTWTDWEECSVTCGTGLQRRTRSCSNPAPNNYGRHCDGAAADHQLCTNKRCQPKEQAPAAAFFVYKPVIGTGSYPSPLKYLLQQYNVGRVFNLSSGEFACRQAGQYIFFATIFQDHWAYCYFYKNENRSVQYAGYVGSRNHFSLGTGIILLDLVPGDRVYLSDCHGISSHTESSFTGFLTGAYVDV